MPTDSNQHDVKDDDNRTFAATYARDTDAYIALQKEAACFIGSEFRLLECEQWLERLSADPLASANVPNPSALFAVLRALRATVHSLSETRTYITNELINNPGLLQRGTAKQLLLGAERRCAILSQIEHLNCKDVAKLSGIFVENSDAAVAKLKADSELFSVIGPGNEELFPAYQFEPFNGTIRPEIKQIIAAFPRGSSGWVLAFWFYAPNGYLGGARPHEYLSIDPVAVVRAAQSTNASLDY